MKTTTTEQELSKSNRYKIEQRISESPNLKQYIAIDNET